MMDSAARRLARQAAVGFVHPESFGASPNAIPPQNTTAIQRALNACSASGGHVYLGTPGTYQINQTLIIYSNTTLELGAGVTIQQAPNINNNLLVNYAHSTGTGRDSNITIKGGIWDYNYAQNSAGAQNLTTMCNIMQHVDGLTIKNVIMNSAAKYTWLVQDITRLDVDGIYFNNTNSDGFHMQPPITYADIRNLKGTTTDDFLAMTVGDYTPYNITPTSGSQNFTYIKVDGLFPNGALNGVKIAGNSYGIFDSISIANVYGSVQNYGINCMNDSNLTNTQIGDLFIENIKTTSTVGNNMMQFTVNSINNLVIENVAVVDPQTQTIHILSPTVANTVTIKNVSSQMALNRATGTVAVDSGATVKKLVLDSFYVSYETSSSLNISMLQVSGTINELQISNSEIVYPSTYGFGVYHKGGSIGTMRLSNVLMSGGNTFYDQTTTGFSQINITSNNFEADNLGANAFNILGSAEFRFANNRFNGLTGVPVNAATSGTTVTIVGESEYANTFVTVTSGATVYVKGIGIRADVSTLTRRLGDTAFNTNASLSCGTGQCITDGNNWKNIFTGSTY